VVVRYFKPLLKAAGLPDIRFYDLRHTMASQMIRNKQDIKMVSQRLGHEDVGFTLKVYHHVRPGTDEEATEGFDEMFTKKRTG